MKECVATGTDGSVGGRADGCRQGCSDIEYKNCIVAAEPQMRASQESVLAIESQRDGP